MSVQQRNFFRIDVMLPMAYVIVPESELQAPLPSHVDSTFIKDFFFHQFNDLDQRLHDNLDAIRQKSHILAETLDALNQKLDFFIRSIDENTLLHTLPVQSFNISAGGMAIETRDLLTPHHHLNVIMTLDPKDPPAIARARVVKSLGEGSKAGTHRTALEFTTMSEETRRRLVFFIQAKEIEMAGKK